MIEYKETNKMLHYIIAASLLLILIFLYVGFRPIFILASLALCIFCIDYSIIPFHYLYKAFMKWLPLLLELNILNGILIFTRIFLLSKFISFILITICVIRNIQVIYHYHLPIKDHHRFYIENEIQILSKLFLIKLKNLYHRLLQVFNYNDEHDLEKFQLEQINSVESAVNENDETIQRFQNLADDLSSPIISNMDCSSSATPPIRRRHQRILQQTGFEPLSQTPITPAHTNSAKTKILHSTINGSYAGPETRNRKRTVGNKQIVE